MRRTLRIVGRPNATLFVAMVLLALGLVLLPPRSARGATTAFHCTSLLPVGYLHAVSGLHAVPARGNATQTGTSVTCAFSFTPPLPPGFRLGPLKFTLSTRQTDRAALKTRFSNELGSYPGLGKQAHEEVSPVGMITIVAIGNGFTLQLSSGERRLTTTMIAAIARKLFAEAGG